VGIGVGNRSSTGSSYSLLAYSLLATCAAVNMLVRIISQSLLRRRRRKLLGALAITLGITAVTAVATIALDVGDKVNRELRSFGANISVMPATDSLSVSVGGVEYRPVGSGAFIPEDSLVNLKKIFWRNNILAFAPYLPVPAITLGHRITLVGTWFNKDLKVSSSEVFSTGIAKLHATWRITGQWPREGAASECLAGYRLARVLGVQEGQELTVSPEASNVLRGSGLLPVGSTKLRVRGVIHAGGSEDDEILAPLETVQKLAGLEGKVRRVEVSALTKPEDDFARSDISRMTPAQFEHWSCSPYVRSIAYQITEALPGVEAKPIFPVADTEGKILNRVEILMILLGITALTAATLAVLSMMLAAILERRTEIALFKSLGATDALVAAVFLLESSAIGLLGGLAGYLGGSALAWRLAITLFGVPAVIHWVLLPGAVALALIVTVVGSALPLARGLKVSVATGLRD